jgi:hypothetical protein
MGHLLLQISDGGARRCKDCPGHDFLRQVGRPLHASFHEKTLEFCGCSAGRGERVARASRFGPEAELSMPLILGLGGAFVAGTILWSVNLIRHFRRAA